MRLKNLKMKKLKTQMRINPKINNFIANMPLSMVAPLIFAVIFTVMFTYSRLEPHVEEVDLGYVIANRGKPEFILLDVRSEVIFNGRAPFAGMKMPPIEGIPGGHIPAWSRRKRPAFRPVASRR